MAPFKARQLDSNGSYPSDTSMVGAKKDPNNEKIGDQEEDSTMVSF